jgi:hypothetical protein
MNDLLPILSGLIVVSALAVVASSDKKDNKKDDKKDNKEVKERKEYKPKEKKDDDDLKKLFGYFKKNLSVKKKPKRYHKVYSRGRTKKDVRGKTLYEFRSVSK